MTAWHRLWNWILFGTCGLLLTLVVACKVPVQQLPTAPAICDSKQQNGLSLQTGSASTIVGTSLFTATLERSLVVSSGGTGGGSESHLLVQRSVLNGGSVSSPATMTLQVDTQTSSKGVVQLSLNFGSGFHGVQQITFISSDRVTIQGTIDGRAITPYSIKSDPKGIRFADGSALSAMSVDDDVKQALPKLLLGIQGKCVQTPGAASADLKLHPDNPMGGGDPPAHPPNFNMGPCIFCIVKGVAGEVLCDAQAVVSAGICGPLYPVCLGAEWALCLVSYLDWLGNTCHVHGTPGGSSGPPCCPLDCGNGCCDTGENCAGPGPNPLSPTLCCSAGTTSCGVNCCVAGQTCVGGNTCCPSGSACGLFCCSAGQTCLTNGTCCATGSACGGKSCCGPNQTCEMPNGVCCNNGVAFCNGACCPDPRDICDPNTGACTPQCAAGTTTCGTTCCSTGQTCMNGSCCPTASVCTGTNGSSCCGAGQLCCIGTGAPGNRQCITPVEPYPWCGETQPNFMNCNVPPASVCFKPGSQCLSRCSGGLCSTDQFCTPP